MLDPQLARPVELLVGMVLRPARAGIHAERHVVIGAIAMYEDEPSEKVHDVLSEAIFGDHPLGRPIIGTADVISSVPVPDIAAYHDERYVSPNLVVTAAGNLEHERLVELVQRLAPAPHGSVEPFEPAPAALAGPRACFYSKQTEQYHLCLGAPGISRADERRFALRVLDTILGGSSSSRLFPEVREKRGLAYAVYSYSSQYADTGQVGVYVGTRPDNVTEAMEVIAAELDRQREDPASGEELDRAKE